MRSKNEVSVVVALAVAALLALVAPFAELRILAHSVTEEYASFDDGKLFLVIVAVAFGLHLGRLHLAGFILTSVAATLVVFDMFDIARQPTDPVVGGLFLSPAAFALLVVSIGAIVVGVLASREKKAARNAGISAGQFGFPGIHGIAPGWYPSPMQVGAYQYWDGRQWVGAPVPAPE